jgi:hypothetical protein
MCHTCKVASKIFDAPNKGTVAENSGSWISLFSLPPTLKRVILIMAIWGVNIADYVPQEKWPSWGCSKQYRNNFRAGCQRLDSCAVNFITVAVCWQGRQRSWLSAVCGTAECHGIILNPVSNPIQATNTNPVPVVFPDLDLWQDQDL